MRVYSFCVPQMGGEDGDTANGIGDGGLQCWWLLGGCYCFGDNNMRVVVLYGSSHELGEVNPTNYAIFN